MGIFNRRAKTQTEESNQIVLQIGSYGGLTPAYYAPDGGMFSNEAAASCIQTNALYCSKVEFSSVRILPDGERKHDYAHLDKLLQYSPNPLMTAAVFWERTASFYYKYSNAFIYKEVDPFGKIIAFWSIDPSSVKFDKISTGEILLKFTLNGHDVVIPYSEIIHIAREVTKDVMFGGDANSPIKRVIDLINLNYKGIENAILTSTFIRFIGEYATKINKTELKKKAKEFTDNYLNVKSDSQVGIVFSDSSVKLTPVQAQQQKTANYAEQNQWNQAVYKFFGCPEKVIAGTANEDEMTSYYERTPETFFERAAQEMTRKLFTDREFDMGNRIVYSDRKMNYLSMKTRLELFTKAREIGAFTLGTLGDLLGLPVPSGKRNVVVTSQNYNDSLKDQSNGDKEKPKETDESDGSSGNSKEEGDGDAGNQKSDE